MDILVIDIGGTSVKLFHSGTQELRRFPSGKSLTPQLLVDTVTRETEGWKYDVISMGYPGKVGPSGPRDEPGNLGDGWIGFDFEAAFGRHILIVNDAVLQALGGYAGGKMLFLGFGTGLGSAFVTDSLVLPLELGGLAHNESEMLWQRVGRHGLEQNGQEQWLRTVTDMVVRLRLAFNADYVLIGGGNAALVDPLPECTRRGGNEDAFIGGMRLWEDGVKHHEGLSTRMWSVL